MVAQFARVLLATSILAAASPASAQSEAQTVAELKAQVEALIKRVHVLEQARTPAGQTPSSGQPNPTTPAVAARSAAAALPAGRTDGGVKASTVVSRDVPAAPIDRPLQKPGSAIQVSASSESGEVAIRVGTVIEDTDLDPTGRGKSSTQTLSLTASAPINKGADRTDLGTLDAFTNSSMLKLRWTGFTIPIAIPRMSASAHVRQRYVDIVAAARTVCLRQAGTDEKAIEECNGEDNVDFIATYNPTEADEYLALAFPGPSFAWGLEGSIGYHKLGFFDATTLEKKSLERVPFGAKAFVTLFPGIDLLSLTGALEYQHDYEDQDSAVLCPLATTGPVQCVDGPIGSPSRKTSLLASLEVRKQFELLNFFIPRVGIAPLVTYDFKDKKGGFDLPIYLVPDAKGNLLGGIRFGYRTDTDDVAVGVFVGTAFSFRP